MPTLASMVVISLRDGAVHLSAHGSDGVCHAHASRELGLQAHGALNPEDTWRNVRTGVKDVLRRSKLAASSVRAVALVGGPPIVVCAGRDGSAQAPCAGVPLAELTRYAQELEPQVGSLLLANLAGRSMSPSALALQARWIAQHARRSWHDCQYLLEIRDFVRLKLTDHAASDPATASRSLLFNTRNRSWSKQLASRWEIPSEILPPVFPGGHIAGRVSVEGGRASGLSAGTPVISGGDALSCAALALGCTSQPSALINLGGTSGQALFLDAYQRDKSGIYQAGCHCLDTTWTLALDQDTQTGIDWLTQQLPPRAGRKWNLEQLTELAAEVAPGADGLLDADLFGQRCVLGWERHHSLGHLARAAFERSARQLASLCQAVPQVARVYIFGPGTQSSLWCQTLADACAAPVSYTSCEDLPAVGAAQLAAQAVGCTEALAPLPLHTLEPRPAASAALHSAAQRLQHMQQPLAHRTTT